jgi:FkbM family methyltransferase
MKKIKLLYSYAISELSDKFNLLSFMESWSFPPSNILSLAIKNINIKSVDYMEVDGCQTARVETYDGLSFLGPVKKEELLCGGFSLRRIKKLITKELNLDTLVGDAQAALIHNLSLRYILEFSSYPYWAVRTSNLRAGDTFVDIGAFRGYVSIKASLKVGSEGKVIAIEPIEKNIKFIKEQKKINNLSQLEIIESVFSISETNEVDFYRTENQANSEVKEHINANAKKIVLSSTSITDLSNRIKDIGSTRVIISLTTNGTEVDLLIPLLKSLKEIKTPYVEIIIPIIYIKDEINNVIEKSRIDNISVTLRYPWLIVIMANK